MNLDELRGGINGIDDALLRLYCQRMELVEQVARYKIENNLPVFHPEREKQIIERMGDKAPIDLRPGAQVLFSTLMDISKSYQHGLIAQREEAGELRRTLEKALEDPHPVPARAAVACAGVPGAYAHEAALAMFEEPDVQFYTHFEEVFRAVADGKAPFGVLPIENSSAGSVGAVYDLLREHRLYICKSIKLPIRHCLLTAGGTRLEDITDVYSHDQGLSQCSAFLSARKGIVQHTYSTTAAAAQYVAQCGAPGAAAIASAQCARLYGLHTVSDCIQNAQHNFTRFILISRQLIIPPDAGKISLSLTLPHVTGSLYRLITRFAMQSLNLCKLESRPMPETDFEFLFYFDFEGSVRQQPVLDLLCSLSRELARFDFLGNY